MGYHGCEAERGRAVVRGDADLIPSANEDDWLGPGIYFWQSDAKRAMEWACERSEPGRGYKEPFVIGAVIDLGNCLDLTERSNIELIKSVHASLVALDAEAGKGVPKVAAKKSPYDKGEDYSRRFLDNAVMRHLHEYIKRGGMEPFDSIIGVFTEGDPIYGGSVFREKTHCQIAVLKPSLIHGYFLPRPYPA